MNIEQQFNRIAQEYDQNRKKFIPCFRDFYETSTNFLTANLIPPKRILDLGAGTGLLSSFWFEHFPNAQYVLVDIAEEMLEVARERFDGLPNVRYETMDYSRTLPDGQFDVILSALSIHHLEHLQKQELFSRIYERLPQDGIFINYDQFCAGETKMNTWFNSYWEGQLGNSGLTEQDIALWQERRKLDRECTLEQELGMLRASGFAEVQCVYSYQKFSVIAAVKCSPKK